MTDTPDWRESLRRRMAERDARPPMEIVREMLGGEVADAGSLAEVRAGFALVAASTTRGLRRDLDALRRVLATPQPPGTLAHVVAWDANWVLDDLSDSAAEAFLGQVAAVLAEVIDEAERARGSRRGPAATDG